MRIIDTDASFDAALPTLAPAVKRLLHERREQLRADLELGAEIEGFATFVIVQPSDTFSAVEAVAGFPIAEDYPPWEWVLDHGCLFEAPIIVSDDGAGIILIVPDEVGIDPTLLSVLRAQAELAAPAGS